MPVKQDGGHRNGGKRSGSRGDTAMWGRGAHYGGRKYVHCFIYSKGKILFLKS